MKSEEHFFTIGYEGRKIDDYIESLLAHGVKVLIDVRRNPISRKKGFSKNSLAGFLRNHHIDYIHMPELGISSDQRKNIKTDDDYKKLFIHYKKNELAENQTSIRKIIDILQINKRVAITCFEREVEKCHRHCVSQAVATLHGHLLVEDI